MKWLLAVLIALSFSAAASAQGLQCRTSPPGASTPYCASEAFVSESRGTLTPEAFASLPACNSTTAGQTAAVTDSTTDTFGAVITGAGSFNVLAYCNGTNWTVAGGGTAPGTVTEQKNTAGAGLAISGNCDNTSTNAGSPCQYALTLNSATLQASPSNPVGVGNATKMMGLGSTCKLTPTYSTRVRFEINMTVSETSVPQSPQVQLQFGTGTAPANGAAATGTSLGGLRSSTINTAGGGAQVHVAGIATALTPGTAYWFDVALGGGSAGTSTIVNVDCNAMEVL